MQFKPRFVLLWLKILFCKKYTNATTLTLAPIWFPHCPACRCTISLMLIYGYKETSRYRAVKGCSFVCFYTGDCRVLLYVLVFAKSPCVKHQTTAEIQWHGRAVAMVLYSTQGVGRNFPAPDPSIHEVTAERMWTCMYAYTQVYMGVHLYLCK